MLTDQDVLQELQALGTEQNRKTYRRHGVGDDTYGVSYANLGALRKRIKINHALAQQLWLTGNHDARVLATMIADPKQMDEALLTAWANDLRNHTLTDAFVGLAAKTPLVRTCAEQWITSDSEWLGRAGWHLLGQLAMQDSTLDDRYFEPYLPRIGQEIHAAKNRVKEAMNNTLIAIGLRNDHLAAQAIAVAERIGKVDVDHGDTSCKTPDAIAYIHKARARQQSRSPKAS